MKRTAKATTTATITTKAGIVVLRAETDDPEINALRYQQKRNFMAILLLSIGVPMITCGDEFSRTQKGNNNAYCQDNEISWVNWDLKPEDRKFLEFVRKVVGLRKRLVAIHRKDFFRGKKVDSDNFVNELLWLRPDGNLMKDKHWQDPVAKVVGVLVEGNDLEEIDLTTGQRLMGAVGVVDLHASHVDIPFVLPSHKNHDAWDMVLDTSETIEMRSWEAGEEFLAQPRTVTVFVCHEHEKHEHVEA